MFGEGGAEPDWRMRPAPELHEGRRIGIDERVVSEELEAGLASGLGIGDDAVHDLFAKDVGGVLLVAGEAVLNWLAEEADDT